MHQGDRVVLSQIPKLNNLKALETPDLSNSGRTGRYNELPAVKSETKFLNCSCYPPYVAGLIEAIEQENRRPHVKTGFAQ